jgi:hypothetical protein
LAERLEEVCSLDLDQLDIDLPRGFGRDWGPTKTWAKFQIGHEKAQQLVKGNDILHLDFCISSCTIFQRFGMGLFLLRRV